MKTIALLAVLFACAFAAKDHEESITQINDLIFYASKGFETGLYKEEPEMSDMCAGNWSEPILEELLTAVDELGQDMTTNMVLILGDTAQIAVRDYDYCGWRTLASGLYEHCFTKGKCTVQRITINVTLNMNKITTEFAEIMTHLASTIKTREEYIAMISGVSESSGSILQMITGFKG